MRKSTGERVSIIEGKHPVVFVCPHGADDINTSVLAESAAKAMGGYAVINRGWERAAQVDIFKDKADCNNLVHCQEDVVRDEFLDPIIRFSNRILRHGKRACLINIHGLGRNARQIAGDEDLALVLGFGDGSPPSYTCPVWFKNLFTHNFRGFGEVYLASPSGPYAGWGRHNLNQLFRKHQTDPRIISMQLEFVRQVRNSEAAAELTGEVLAEAIYNTINQDSWTPPNDFSIRYF